MNMSEPWIFGLVAMSAFVVLICLAFVSFSESIRGRVRRTFSCPVDGREVTALFSADNFRTERYEDVLACSAFADSSRVSCDKPCLRIAKPLLTVSSPGGAPA
jgi:hypothetical protein